MDIATMRARVHLCRRLLLDRGLGGNRPGFPVFRHLAAGHQHRHDDRHVPDGVLIKNTQNRDSAALHLKLDELIRVSESARNKLLDLEDLTEAELEHLKGSFTKLAGKEPDNSLLHEAAEDLDMAGAEIQEAKEKVATVAGRKP
jgi:Low affinity iron permease